MKEVVFKNKKVSIYIEERFIILSLDVQKDNLPKGFEYPGIPVFRQPAAPTRHRDL
jgi:hypothetical protein